MILTQNQYSDDLLGLRSQSVVDVEDNDATGYSHVSQKTRVPSSTEVWRGRKQKQGNKETRKQGTRNKEQGKKGTTTRKQGNMETREQGNNGDPIISHISVQGDCPSSMSIDEASLIFFPIEHLFIEEIFAIDILRSVFVNFIFDSLLAHGLSLSHHGLRHGL